MPVPSALVVKNASNNRPAIPFGKPGPVSRTLRVICPSCALARMRTWRRRCTRRRIPSFPALCRRAAGGPTTLRRRRRRWRATRPRSPSSRRAPTCVRSRRGHRSAAPVRAWWRGAKKWRRASGARSPTSPTGDGRRQGGATRHPVCSSSGWRPRRTAPTAPGASSPATAAVTGCSPRSIGLDSRRSPRRSTPATAFGSRAPGSLRPSAAPRPATSRRRASATRVLTGSTVRWRSCSTRCAASSRWVRSPGPRRWARWHATG